MMRTSAHLLPIVLVSAFAAGALVLVAYLLWPTWSTRGSSAPAANALPSTIGSRWALVRILCRRGEVAENTVKNSRNRGLVGRGPTNQRRISHATMASRSVPGHGNTQGALRRQAGTINLPLRIM